MDFDFVGIGEAEIKYLLIAEIVETFVERLREFGVDLVNSVDRGRFGVVEVFALANLKFLRAGRIGDPCCNDGGSRGEGGRSFSVVTSAGEIHAGVGEFAEEFSDLRTIGAKGLWLQDLPLFFVPAEFDRLTFVNQFEAADLIGVDREQALVPEIIEILGNRILEIAGDGEDTTDRQRAWHRRSFR